MFILSLYYLIVILLEFKVNLKVFCFMVLSELLGNCITRASSIHGFAVQILGASITPLLLPFGLYSYFYYPYIIQPGYGNIDLPAGS